MRASGQRCGPTQDEKVGQACTLEPGSKHRRGLRAIAAVGSVWLGASLAACVETGDFGRVKHSAWNQALFATGTIAAAGRGEPVSPYAFTDDEEALRGRAWRFLVPAQERAWFERILADFVATRILPPEILPEDPSAYHRALLSVASRSPASRYRRLSEDAMADARLIEPFAAVASRVLIADGVRLRSLAYVHALAPAEIAAATARVAENRCLIAWVAAGLDRRAEAYRFSLEHLVIETPQADAVPVEHALAILRRERGVLDGFAIPPLAGVACAVASEVTSVVGPPSPLRPAPAPTPPLVRKG